MTFREDPTHDRAPARRALPLACLAVGLVTLGLGLGLAGCVPSAPPQPIPAPTPTAAPPVAPPQVVTPTYDSWMDVPATPGDWFYAAQDAETLATFGTSPATSDTRLVFVCRKAQQRIAIGYVGEAAGPVQMLVRTETVDRTLTANPAQGRTPLIVAELTVRDPLLDAMAFSKGRIAVDVAGHAPLYLPAYPELTRVIEDCRR